jgi:ATP-independent RNA helicase DbpA
LSNTNFLSLNLNENLIQNISLLGYIEMTPIQAQSLPDILRGQDVIGQGNTGSGKTAAFSLGLLNKLNVKSFRIQSLVLCPTRELAAQVAGEIRKLARTIHNIKVLSLCGGTPFGPQVGSLEHGAHIIVGTPGRVLDHLNKKTLNLDNLTTLVLDEADRMLDMGFQPSLDAIVSQAPKKRQTLLFSATYPDEIQKVSSRIMLNPVIVRVASSEQRDTIKQHFYKIKDEPHRLLALRSLLVKYRPKSTIVFCETKKETQNVSSQLVSFGFSAVALHGDMEQKDRDQTLIRFTNESASILVATDVAARGLDIVALAAVVNFRIARDAEVHVHRVGRTGRAGSAGIAYTLFDEKEHHKVNILERYLDLVIIPEPLPLSTNTNEDPLVSSMETLQIDGGKKQKIRAGDVLGALTAENGINSSQVGKIHIKDNWSFVAVSADVYKIALHKLSTGKLKGRSFRVRLIRGL